MPAKKKTTTTPAKPRKTPPGQKPTSARTGVAMPVNPNKLTKARHKAIISLLKAGNYPSVAAAHCRIHINTLRNWLRWGRDVMDETGEKVLTPGREPYRQFCVEYEEAVAIYEAESIEKIGKDDSWKARAWILTKRFPERFGNRVAVESSGPSGSNVITPQITLVIAGKADEPWTYGNAETETTEKADDGADDELGNFDPMK